MDLAFIELTLFVIALMSVYKFLVKNHKFFEKRRVKYLEPTILFGNFLGLLTGRENGISIFEKPYNKFKNEKIFGMFQLLTPLFMVTDADIVKQITIKDFDHFVNHDGSLTRGSDGIFGKSVLLLENNQWREMRNYLSPIFTSLKMKTMFHHLTSCAQDLTDYFDEEIKAKGRLVIEAKDIFSRFTAESISITSLGFKGNCIKDKNSEVYKIAKDIQDDFSSGWGAFKMSIIPNMPALAKFLGIKIFRQSTHDFFKKYVIDEIKRREAQGITKANDVIQLLIQAKNGQLNAESGNSETKVAKKFIDWNDEELIAAQIFIFFAGGFETTSTLMQMCSWELAMNQNVQKELIQEVDEVLATLNGQPVSYEALNKMKFLDMVVNEALRKWPPLPFGIRECNKDYVLHTSDGQPIELIKGDKIGIPFRFIQRDPKYFEDPLKFDPTRFSDENKHKINPSTLLSFGSGPRICLGSRLAILETKLAFFTILSRFTIEVCEKTPKQFTYTASPVSFKEDLYVELKPRKQKM